MKIFFALFLLLPSVCFASSFDKFVEKANNQSVLSVISQSNSHISLRDKSNAVIDVDRKNYDAEISKVIAEEKTNNALKALFLGKELTEVGTIYAQKSLVHATNLSCIGAGGTCIFLASTSIVFWPNGVIAGMCGAAVYACDKISTSILADLDKKMEEAVKREKAALASGGGGTVTSNPEAGTADGSTGGSSALGDFHPVIGTGNSGTHGSNPSSSSGTEGSGGSEPPDVRLPPWTITAPAPEPKVGDPHKTDE